MEQHIDIRAGRVSLPGDLVVPEGASAVVVFAHGSGSSRLSVRNRQVASALTRSGRIGTLLFDLLTPQEDAFVQNRFDIGLLTERLVVASRAVMEMPGAQGFSLGLFGASTGAAAAIEAAVRLPGDVRAVVSRGGRPDLAADALPALRVPTLLIVGGLDSQVIEMNRDALARIVSAEKRLEIVPGATHLFEEPGTLEQVARLAVDWFEDHLGAGG